MHIGRYLMTNKSNNFVHILWLPLLVDFKTCRRFSWGFAVLVWMYSFFNSVTDRGTTNLPKV
ncbi:hypothetical protein AHAS_Ahas13G0327400 [Arachis hypogaea]